MLKDKLEFEIKKHSKFGKFHIVNGRIDNIGSSIGVDPGVNFGLTIINAYHVRVINGKFPSENRKGWHGVHIYDYIIGLFGSDQLTKTMYPYHEIPAIVEGAAYHSQFGQVGLEEVRFAFFLALAHLGFKVEIVPPATIRKLAFGDGKQQAGDLWPWLNHNGADSLGMALYGLEKYGKN
jgi:hypothetical protein